MTRIPRSILALLAALALVLAACGGGGDTTTDDTSSPTDAATDGQTEGAGDDGQAADGCDESDPIKAGASLSLSGPAANIGEQAQHGAEMAVEDINANGGILGRCVELVLKDDGGDPTKAAQVAREMVDQDQVAFIVGPFLSSALAASLEVSNSAQVPHVGAGVLPDAGDVSKYPYQFRTEVPAALQGQTFIAYMQEAGYSQAGVLAVNNALGTAASDALKASAEGTGIEVTTVEFHESGQVDLTSQVQNVRDSGADVYIVMNTAAPDQIAAIEARNQIGWDVPTLGFSSMGYKEITEAVGQDSMEGVLAGQAYLQLSRNPDTGDIIGGQVVLDFIETYKQYLGVEEMPFTIQQAAGIWDSFQMMAMAINEVGTVEADGIKDYLESNGYEGVKADYTYDAERHDGVGLDDLVFVKAPSLDENGTYELAPGTEIPDDV